MPSELSQACEKYEITIQPEYLGTRRDGTTYQDTWICKIFCQGRTESFDFFTGLGHRKPTRKTVTMRDDGAFVEQNKSYSPMQAYVHGMTKIPSPTAADVLSCLISDASACEESYEDWCSDFGAEDSLNTLHTYLACQKSGRRVMRLLGALFHELRELEH